MFAELNEALQRRSKTWRYINAAMSCCAASWPFAMRGTVRRLQIENHTLRDALRAANAELRRHRLLIGSLQEGDERITAAVHRALNRSV